MLIARNIFCLPLWAMAHALVFRNCSRYDEIEVNLIKTAGKKSFREAGCLISGSKRSEKR
jgi:hypothetical protein